MKIRINWRECLPREKIYPFMDTIFKGYGQLFICSNRMTGLFIFLAILFISAESCLLTIIGAAASLLTARLIGARPSHIHFGCYGFNGVVLGIAWPWYIKLNAISVMMLFFLSAASTVLLKYCIDKSARSRSNLPVFSLPPLIVVWLVYILAACVPSWKPLMGPDPIISEYIQTYESSVLRLYNKPWTNLTIGMYLDTFKIHLLVIAFLAIGIFRHSRVSAAVAATATTVTLALVYLIKGINGFGHIDTYLYNTVPCALALGGAFLVLNRQVGLLILVNVVVIVFTVYAGLSHFQFPLFIAPFNFFTILSIWLVKKGILKKEHGFYAVPMELIFSPETAEHWRKGEIYAQNYWRGIEQSWAPLKS